MKSELVVCITLLVCATMAFPQRPSYVPNPVNYPSVLPQYSSNTSTSASSIASSTSGVVDNRFGQGQGANTNANINNPLVDPYIINRVPDWPKEHQPFWYLNAQHIANHLNQPRDMQAVQPVPVKSSFVG